MESLAADDTFAVLAKIQADLEAVMRERDVASRERDHVCRERDTYRKAYEAAKLELERLKRGLFGQKREKVDPAQVALVFSAFEKLLATAGALAPTEEEAEMLAKAHEAIVETAASSSPGDGGKPRPVPPKPRRRLQDALLPEVVIDLGMTGPDVRVASTSALRFGRSAAASLARQGAHREGLRPSPWALRGRRRDE